MVCGRKTETKTDMKTTHFLPTLVALLVLGGSSAVVMAQNRGECPFGHEPGYGRTLTPEAREEHRQAMQQLREELLAKRAAGTITAEEEAWLTRTERRGGPGLGNGPRGPGGGKGPGPGMGKGQQKRQGLRDGTGPRSEDGTCPLGNPPRRAGRANR